MGGRGASSGGGNNNFQMLSAPPQIQPTVQMAQQANAGTFSDTDKRPFHTLLGGRNYFNKQNLTIDEQIATVNYLSNGTESGSLYSMSQNMNYALATGKPLNANQQYVYNNLMSSMHNLGENLTLTRYDHETFINNILQQKGINQSYDRMTLPQLKNALVGTQYGESKLVSVSHNDFVNAPIQTKNVFTNRAVKITYNANANVQAMMPGNGPGGSVGEMILAPSGRNPNYTIQDVKFTGTTARRKGTQSFTLPQVEIVVGVSKQS